MKPCDCCNGTGWSIETVDGIRSGVACGHCIGRGTIPETPQEVKKRQAVIRSERLTSALHPPPTLIIVTIPPSQEAAS